MRRIAPVDIGEHEPNEIDTAKPKMALADPSTLSVDDRYQRDLSKKSVALIRRMVTGWDWTAFKPPVVVEDDEGFNVIDGQHTAIAAHMHPGVTMIPIIIVSAETLEARAMSFVKHNRDRLAVTKIDEWVALAAAGDEHALEIRLACERAGVRILRAPPYKWEVGDTQALGPISAILRQRYPAGLGRVLRACVAAKLAPISSMDLKAVECLLFWPEYRNEITEDKVIAALAGDRTKLDGDAARFAIERGMPKWRALASQIYIQRNGRRAA